MLVKSIYHADKRDGDGDAIFFVVRGPRRDVPFTYWRQFLRYCIRTVEANKGFDRAKIRIHKIETLLSRRGKEIDWNSPYTDDSKQEEALYQLFNECGRERLGSDGEAQWTVRFGPGLANHSCLPNTLFVTNQEPVQIIALAPIQKDEEVTISKISLDHLLSDRANRWGHLAPYSLKQDCCLCIICSDEVASIHHEKLMAEKKDMYKDYTILGNLTFLRPILSFDNVQVFHEINIARLITKIEALRLISLLPRTIRMAQVIYSSCRERKLMVEKLLYFHHKLNSLLCRWKPAETLNPLIFAHDKDDLFL
jgi:hypothetical protein